MLLWPFNKYPGTDYETFNWEWILKTVKEWVATMHTFKNDITAAWNAMQADWQEFETSMTDDWQEFIDDTYKDQITEILEDHPEWVTTVMDGAITKPKINAAFLKEIENCYTTPEMYGAAGNGTTDDTQAIKDAIDAGTIIVFDPDAVYKTSSEIRIPSNRYLYGNGCTIKATHNGKIFTNEHYDTSNTNHNIKIKNFILDGSENLLATQQANMLYFCGVENLEIAECKCQNTTSDGIYIGSYNSLRQNKNVWIHDCEIENYMRQGISVVEGDVVIERCTIGTGEDDIQTFSIDFEPNQTYENVSGVVRDCELLHGLNFYGRNSNAQKDITIENTKIEREAALAHTAIIMDTIDNCDINNCLVEDNAGTAISCYIVPGKTNITGSVLRSNDICLYISDCSNTVVAKNILTITNTAADTNSGAINILNSTGTIESNTISSASRGVKTRGSGTYSILNNTIKTANDGIDLTGTNTTRVIGNAVMNCAHYGIYLENSENVIDGNKIVGDSNSPTTRAITFNNASNNVIVNNMMKNCTAGITPTPSTGITENNLTL